jgi:phosphoserine phosphatase RsbU/P
MTDTLMMPTSPANGASSHHLVCSEIWGGTEAISQEVSTAGISASITSAAAGGGRGGDIHYLSYCTLDFLTRIAIADVRGHGESVALLSSWVYLALQVQMNTLAGDQVLSELNRKVHARGLDSMTTAAVLSYDRNQRRLHFCYAGHPPAMVWQRPTGWQRLENRDEAETSNLPLGVMAATEYEQGDVVLTPGDRFVVFTDGLLDAENRNGEPFGAERLSRVLENESAASISNLKQAVLNDLLDHTNGLALEDDLTLLTAEVR